MASHATLTTVDDDILYCSGSPVCGEFPQEEQKLEVESREGGLFLGSPSDYLSGEARIERASAHWDKIGRPKFIVAPMIDCSELPFHLLCRKYGAQAAYTPMLHARIFSENDKYRSMEFTNSDVCNSSSLSSNKEKLASILSFDKSVITPP